MPRVNLVNCKEPLRDVMTTTQPETANVIVQKHCGLGNLQPSAFKMAKVQRPGDIPHSSQVRAKRETGGKPLEDMVFSARKLAAATREAGSSGERLTTVPENKMQSTALPSSTVRLTPIRRGSLSGIVRPEC